MSARPSGKILMLLVATAVGVGCSSPSSSSSGAKWPWTKAKPTHADEAKNRNGDVLGAPPAPKTAKAGVNKPSLSSRNDLPSTITLRTPRIIDDREIERANR
jgi:hypothetical protein